MEQESPQPFPYQPIEPGKGFRILRLNPSQDFNADIHGDLLHATLENFPPYEALSYVWGQSSDTRPLILQGFTIPTTVNLNSALRYLRHREVPRLLWVDAVCINQTDPKERSTHVGYMKEVYARCTTDLLWLGEEEAILQDGMKAMKYWNTIMEMDTSLRTWDRSPENKEHMAAIEGLFAKPMVWKRVWIMQEISAARSVTLIAGHSSMNWEEVETFLDADNYIKRYGMPDAFHGPFSHDMSIRSFANGVLAYPQVLAHQRRVTRGQSKAYESTLLDVLARFRFTESTDPRDKIYALLGLCSNSLGIEVDYRRSVRDVYIECSRRLIQQDGNLDLICQAPWELYGNEKRRADLPSWVHDFGNPGDTRILFAQRGIFNAGGDQLETPLLISDTGILTLDGFFVGSFGLVRTQVQGAPEPPYPPGSSAAMQWMPDSLLKEGISQGNSSLALFIKNETEPPSPYDTNKRFEMFYRTIMMDCIKYPIHRLEQSHMAQLDALFEDWRSTPLDQNRDIDVDFEVQEKIVDSWKWNFAITDEGVYCMAPRGAELGDEIAVLKGAKVPMVLRPMTDSAWTPAKTYRFIGPCYVHGFMDGEIFLHGDGNETRQRVFNIA